MLFRSRLQVGYREPLFEEELSALRRGLPRLEEMCRQVAEAGVPSALEHHDLLTMSIYVYLTTVACAVIIGFVLGWIARDRPWDND